MACFSSFQVLAEPQYLLDNKALSGQMVKQSTADLCQVAANTLSYLNQGPKYDPNAIIDGVLADKGFNLKRTKKTLEFICQVQKEDSKSGKNRLADPAFIKQHFEMIRWMPDKDQSLKFAKKKALVNNMPKDQILMTKYYIKSARGSDVKTTKTPHALYSLPVDEQKLNFAEAEAKKDTLVRYRYTKQDVLTGILDENQWATPLLWLSRPDLEDTLMQGTIRVDTDSGVKYLNVHRNNGIGYDRKLRKKDQKRYWYFKQVPGPMGYGKDADLKIPILPYVTVAGDIKHLGLGKLVMLTHNNEHRLAVLADTGGAFENNQYQLDYLAGYYKNWREYYKAYKDFPQYFEARFLAVKDYN